MKQHYEETEMKTSRIQILAAAGRTVGGLFARRWVVYSGVQPSKAGRLQVKLLYKISSLYLVF